MEQLIIPNYDWPYYGGLCEGFSEGVVGEASKPYINKEGKWTTDGVFPSATYAFKHVKGSHTGAAPSGVHVQIFLSLGNNKDGHTAWLRPDGTVASSTQSRYHEKPFIHPSLQDLINVYGKANGGCEYLGWSEWTGNIQVLKEKDMELINEGDVINAWDWMYGAKPTQADLDYWIGRTFKDLSYSKFSVEFANLHAQVGNNEYEIYVPPVQYVKKGTK